MDVKITWRKMDRTPRGMWLQAIWGDYSADDVLEEMQRWSDENDCGTRMSYDMWKFKNTPQVTAFLLRWS